LARNQVCCRAHVKQIASVEAKVSTFSNFRQAVSRRRKAARSVTDERDLSAKSIVNKDVIRVIIFLLTVYQIGGRAGKSNGASIRTNDGVKLPLV
jgi:hypothetical protein